MLQVSVSISENNKNLKLRKQKKYLATFKILAELEHLSLI